MKCQKYVQINSSRYLNGVGVAGHIFVCMFIYLVIYEGNILRE